MKRINFVLLALLGSIIAFGYSEQALSRLSEQDLGIKLKFENSSSVPITLMITQFGSCVGERNINSFRNLSVGGASQYYSFTWKGDQVGSRYCNFNFSERYIVFDVYKNFGSTIGNNYAGFIRLVDGRVPQYGYKDLSLEFDPNTRGAVKAVAIENGHVWNVSIFNSKLRVRSESL